tara:strand:- start:1710 stop:2123 length:414 start_codon:yes stop_codon:yes gene_type:complete
MNETTNHDLALLCSKRNIQLNGIYNAQTIEELEEGNTILNLNGHSHWTCVIKTKDKCVYFDSFGLPPPLRICQMMGDYTYSPKEIQALNSSSCGFYCVACLQFMKGKTDDRRFLIFQNFFNDEYLNNEMVLKRFFNF